MSFVYKRTEPGLWTVGHYGFGGKWEPESDHGSEREAAERAAHLNGAPDTSDCQCGRWTAAIARVATFQSIDVDMHRGDEVTRQIKAHADRGDSASTVFWAGVALGIQAAKDALRGDGS